MSESSLYIGLMSGTSMDGIDAVLVDFSGATPSVVKTASLDWSPKLKEKLSTAAAGGFLTASQWGELDSEVGQAFADAAIEVNQGVKAIAAIGSHGQTVAHQPNGANGFSVQLGNANIIAEKNRYYHSGRFSTSRYRGRRTRRSIGTTLSLRYF